MDFGAVVGTSAEAWDLEQLGYRFIGQGDDLATFANLAEVGHGTRTAQFGSFILTAYGRHPAVTAMEASHVQSASGGRLVIVVGRGFRSAALMGRGPISIDETASYVTALRALLRSESTVWNGDEIPALQGVVPVPVLVSAYGPAVRRMAGSVADGVVIAAGSDRDQLRSFVGDVAQGAETASRSIDELAIWVLSRGSVRNDRSQAVADVRGLLAASAYRHLRSPSQVETVPAELHAALSEFRRRYDAIGFEGYQPSWEGPNAQLISDLGLEEFLLGRFAVAGTPDQCRAQVVEIEAEGVTRIVFAPGARDPETLYARIAVALRLH